ncbi:hypothetical protein B0H16DRAFT_1476660 [Mycena metata]|uniref:Uncharacterized protein n=1 Tax=Mycena metata TaxID=1033252 RepID=A0AAD7MGI7_9AGAR|nr:hypothetical protein B0H16DRAFT_1476660 [Mycena metata]
MPPRKKQKTASGSKATPVSEPPTDFPSAALLTRALEQYPHALSLRSKEHTKAPNQLTELDAWLTNTEKRAAEQSCILSATLMKWKLSRGKSRPTLLGLVAANPETLILKATSTLAKRSLLTLQAPHLLPFMSDEAASFFSRTLGAIKYTDPFYKKFAAAMVAKVQKLNAESSGPDSQAWDSMKLERALFAICILKKHGKGELLDGDVPSDSLKRKRDEP